MQVVPLTLKQVNTYIEQNHRHHKRVQGHRFSFGAIVNNGIVGVIVVGRPVARGCDAYLTAEITRLCTDGTKNLCSFLYAKAARICKELGFKKIQTYHDTLDWDAHIETPPSRKSGTLRVSLKYGGRAKPIAIEDASLVAVDSGSSTPGKAGCQPA